MDPGSADTSYKEGCYQTEWPDFKHNFIRTCGRRPGKGLRQRRQRADCQGVGAAFIDVEIRPDRLVVGDFQGLGLVQAQLLLKIEHACVIGEFRGRA